MRFRFRRSLRIAPGIRLNIGARGVSATLGPRGANVNVGPRGTHANLGIPGTGLSARTRLDGPDPAPRAPASRTSSGGQAIWPWVVLVIAAFLLGLLV